jgi:hypothetical protein
VTGTWSVRRPISDARELLLKLALIAGFFGLGATACCVSFAQTPGAIQFLRGAEVQLPRDLTLTLQPPPPLVQLPGTVRLPRDLTLTLQPPPPLVQLPGTVQLPRNLTLTLQPAPTFAQLFGTPALPPPRNLTLTLQPAPTFAQLFGTPALPSPRNLTLTLQPAPTFAQLFGTPALPSPRNLTLTLQPAPTFAQLFGTPALPPPRNLTLTLQPPASLDQLLGTLQMPATRDLVLTLRPTPPLEQLLGTLQTPATRDLVLTLRPTPPLEQLLGTLQMPATRDLVLTLRPGAEPLAAPPPATTGQAGAPAGFSVQILQVIPRRGANFFDRIDPTGQATVLVAQAGGGTVAPGGGGGGACAAGPSSGGTLTSLGITEDFEATCISLAPLNPALDFLGLRRLRNDFTGPGAPLISIMLTDLASGQRFATVTGLNRTTFSATGLTSRRQGDVPIGTPIRVDGTLRGIEQLVNYTVTACTPAGVVVYRQPNGACN